ncbi:hypothetical protein ACNKHR_09850 [Shigella flexneri]
MPEAAAPQPEICLNCRAVCDLYTTILCGTGHVVYTIRRSSMMSPLRHICPERPMAASLDRCTDGDYRQSGVGCGRVSGCDAG